MDVQCLKVKLKEGQTDTFIKYTENLKKNMNQVVKALSNETMMVESIFLDRAADGDYLIFYTRAESLQKANEYMMQSTDPVDIEGLEIIQKTWDMTASKVLEVLFDVDRIGSVKA